MSDKSRFFGSFEEFSDWVWPGTSGTVSKDWSPSEEGKRMSEETIQELIKSNVCSKCGRKLNYNLTEGGCNSCKHRNNWWATKGDDPMPEFFKPEDFEIDADTKKKYSDWMQYISDKANRLLKERGTVVYGRICSGRDDGWFENNLATTLNGFKEHTHQALLINIQPIEKEDTAEGLLKELLESKLPRKALVVCDDNLNAWYERAKKLLEKK